MIAARFRRLRLLPRGALSNRLVPAIIACMVFLLCLAGSAALILQAGLGSFQRELAGRFTVELPAGPQGPPDAATVARVIDRLALDPAVLSAEPVSTGAMTRLLEPWLGHDASLDDLPLPVLIDIAAVPGGTLDPARLGAALQDVVTGATVEPAVTSLKEIAALAFAVELAAYLVVLIIATCLVAVVVFATRAGLAAHLRLIEIVHQIGAFDRQIAGQFSRHFMLLGLIGGVLGFALAGLLALAVIALAGHAESPFLPTGTTLRSSLLPLLAVPFAVALIAGLAAGLTVRRALRAQV